MYKDARSLACQINIQDFSKNKSGDNQNGPNVPRKDLVE